MVFGGLKGGPQFEFSSARVISHTLAAVLTPLQVETVMEKLGIDYF